jgi:hypothetical protein
MARLLIHVEGQTEEVFVNEVLAGHLYDCGYSQVSARILGNARQRHRRGGIRGWDSVSRDIVRHLSEDRACYASTMVDYYALPQSGDGAWPGRAAAGMLPYLAKAAAVESALHRDITSAMGDGFNPQRFVPFVVMHEFEGLLFSDCQAFATGVGVSGLAGNLQAIRNQFATPEEINDSPLTAPSKRVEALIPGYQKPLLGTLAALEIGLERIRAACPHFQDWLSQLERLANFRTP